MTPAPADLRAPRDRGATPAQLGLRVRRVILAPTAPPDPPDPPDPLARRATPGLLALSVPLAPPARRVWQGRRELTVPLALLVRRVSLVRLGLRGLLVLRGSRGLPDLRGRRATPEIPDLLALRVPRDRRVTPALPGLPVLRVRRATPDLPGLALRGWRHRLCIRTSPRCRPTTPWSTPR